jgi:RNA polymerase sigma-70 factor, ECF subfamily
MSPSPFTDADDVRLTLAGDREAFGRLYDRHARGVRAVAAAVSGDFTSVEDLTQEAFLRGYRRLASLRDAAAFGPWIQGVARLVARERRRQLSREHHHFGADHAELASMDETCPSIELNEEHRRVIAAIVELPERERLAIHAYYLHEQSADQAADAIGMSRSGFYVALERGISRLRKRLEVSSSSPKTRI